METLNKIELQDAITKKDALSLAIINTRLKNLMSVNKGYFIFKEMINGSQYFIEFKYDDTSDLSFKFGCKVKDVIDADCMDIESVDKNTKGKTESLVYWQYE